jgi:hypothetical protein
MNWQDWKLVRGGEVLAYLHNDGKTLVPDLDGAFTIEAAYETTPAFENVGPLFQREAELLDVDSEPENHEWTDIWEVLQEGFVCGVDGWRGAFRRPMDSLQIWAGLVVAPIQQHPDRLARSTHVTCTITWSS